MRVLAAAFLLAAGSASAAQYAEFRSTAVRQCRAIDPSAYQTGLALNPDGYRSFYARSECFQRAAVQFRDAALCGEVRQRRALFSSSWAISSSRCRELVAEGLASDQRTLGEIRRRYFEGAIRLRDFRIERNGNGRDFDIISSFEGGYADGYRLTFEILPAESGAIPVLLYSSGHHIGRDSNLNLFVRQEELRRRFPRFALAHPYAVRAILTLEVGYGGQSGYWSDAFIDRIFPVRERSQSLTRTIRF